VSFVRRAEDVALAKQLIRRAGKDTPVIAKLEKPEAIEILDAILVAADGVMVARGRPRRGNESGARAGGAENDYCASAGVPAPGDHCDADAGVHDRESSADARGSLGCGHAIFDGSDAVMLSAETASGNYPVEAVGMMARIIEEAEASIREFRVRHRRSN